MRLFISYAHKNRATVNDLAEMLERAGHDVWFDTELSGGDNWWQSILDQIEDCDIFIFALSPESTASKACQTEYQYAVDLNKPILPILLKKAELPVGKLAEIQYVPATNLSDTNTALLLSRGMNKLRDRRDAGEFLPPDPLPERPPFPHKDNPLHRLGVDVENFANLSEHARSHVVVQLKGFANSSHRPDATKAREMLRTMLNDPNITVNLQREIQSALPQRNPMRGWLPFGVVMIVIAVVIGVILLSGGGDDPPRATLTSIELVQTETRAAVLALVPTATDTDILPTATETLPPTATNTDVPLTSTPTDTGTPTPTDTPSLTPTNTDVPPTQTHTPTPTDAPSLTPTNTDVPPTPTDTPSPREAAIQLALQGVSSNDAWTPYSEPDEKGIEMVLVPIGCFMMGSEAGDSDEQPVHDQCFDEPFWIDRYEVTNGQFERLNGVAANPSIWTDENRPREQITWFEARDFCVSRGGRLPTEAEWEFAARGTESLIYPWGNEFVADNVVYSENSNGQTAPVGSRLDGASWVGALDMSGNVWEWTHSLYEAYPYVVDDGREADTGDSTDVRRVLRGGSWGNNNTENLRAVNRNWNYPYIRNSGDGFRCARSY